MNKGLSCKKVSPIGFTVHGGATFPKNIIEKYRNLNLRHKDEVVAYSILIPMLLYFMVFSVFPILFVIFLSFTEWNGIMGWPVFVGLRNFATFFTNTDYIVTLARAGVYGFFILFFNVIIGFFIALLLNQKIRGVGLIRTIWYLPVLVPFAVVSQMMSAVLNPVDGIVMNIMRKFMEEPVVFQKSTVWMSFWIIVISVWKGVGGTVIIYLAGLQGIDVSLYEAAKVDGANKARLMWHITLPSIRPITMFVIITGIIGSFLIFEPVQLITQGGPHGTTNTILVRIYEDAFKNFSMGMASASSVVVLVITLALSINQFRISQRPTT